MLGVTNFLAVPSECVNLEGLMLAQTGAQAANFKEIVDFAQDAIRTIAPALSSDNKFDGETPVLSQKESSHSPLPARSLAQDWNEI